MCHTLIEAVETQIAQNATEHEIAVFLEQFCKFAQTFDNTCKAIFDAGVPQVVNWIVTHENSTVVCIQLKLCSATYKPHKKPVTPRIQARASAECAACQGGVEFVEHWLEENKTVTEIENELEATVCKFIPNIKAACDAIAEAGVPTVINWIETNENSTVVCQQLKVCTKGFSYNSFSLKPKVPALKIRPMNNKINLL